MNTRVVAPRAGTAVTALAPELSTISEAISKLPPLVPPPIIAAEISRFAIEGAKALDQAKRAVIRTTDDAGAVADLVKAINTETKKQEEARKAKTAPADGYKDKLMKLYAVGKDALAEAKQILTGKLGAFQSAQARAQAAEIAAREKAAQEEAARLAAAQAALGDAEGAEQILEEAAGLPGEAVNVNVTGAYGATAGQRSRRVGQVDDMLDFLTALVSNPLEEGYLDIINSIEVGQAKLNALAALVIERKIAPIPGFTATEVANTVVR